MLDVIQKYSDAHLDGLTTSREYLGMLVQILGERYLNMDPNEPDGEADKLATLLVGSLVRNK